MKEYDRGIRSRVNVILKGYTGSCEEAPMSLPLSHRTLTLFVRLRTESVTSFSPGQSFERPNTNLSLPGNLLVFTSTASSEDFRQRMINQIKRYVGLKPEEITPEWEAFGKRNRAEINRLSPLITLSLACTYQEAS